MTRILWVIAGLLLSNPAFAAYQYFLSDNFASIDTSRWTVSGNISGGANGLMASAGTGGSLISRVPIPDGSSDYEVRGTVHFGQQGGFYISNVAIASRVSPNGYYAASLNCYVGCTFQLNKMFNGTYSVLTSFPYSPHEGTVLRLITYQNRITAYVDSLPGISLTDNDVLTGQPGVSLGIISTPTGEAISNLQIGLVDRTAPPAVDAQAIRVSALPREVAFRWNASADDMNGIGLAGYTVSRDGVYLGSTATPTFTDETVRVGTNCTYTINAYDQHGNTSPPTSFTVSVPASPPDQRRVGARGLGSYWGAGGEQIDLLSGNLNFSIPVFTAVARGGWSVPFALSYNSQIWRQDAAGTWLNGYDTGFGLGWKLQAGSLAPIYFGSNGLQFLVYTDATGAEYRLDQNNNGVWTSREGTYVAWDSNVGRLYFPDGSFWVMGSESASTEPDAGTLYPTLIQDTNGNQLELHYAAAIGRGDNSSSRLQWVRDHRYPYGGGMSVGYNRDPIPHATSLYATPMNYEFAYASQPLTSPFGDGTQFGTTTLMQSMRSVLNTSHTFQYGSGTGELTQVITPLGGVIEWDYRPYTYSGTGRTYREVQNRYLTASSGATRRTWYVQPDNGANQHASTALTDVGAGSRKVWSFRSDAPYVGLAASYEERDAGGTALLRKDYTWAQDAAQNVYLNSALTTLNPGSTYAVQTKTAQTLDTYGNITQSQAFEYNNLTTPARTYTYQYLTNANYTSRYIRNRLTSATVTAGGQTTTLISNVYDYYDAPLTDRVYLNGFHDPAYDRTFTYRGNLSRTTTLGAVTYKAYDVGGVVTTVGDNTGRWISLTPSSGTDSALPGIIAPNGNNNLATNITYTGTWDVSSVSGPNGATSTTTYDTYGRPATTTIPDGAQTSYTYSYYPSPNTQTATVGNRWKKTTQDGFGRVIKVETGHDGTTVLVTDTEYAPCACSPLGKVSRVSRPHAPNAAVFWTTYTYDAAGRTLSVTLPDNASTTRYSYQGNQTTVTDAAGKWKTFTNDAFGNLTAVTEPDPNDGSGTGRLWTNYTYNVLNQLTRVEMR